MGTPSKSYVRIEFKTALPDEFKKEDDIKKLLINFYNTKEGIIDSNPYIDISNIYLYDREVEFELYSDRSQNLEFQVDLLTEYLDSRDDIEELNSDVWHQVT
jgi:hypothetical protein